MKRILQGAVLMKGVIEAFSMTDGIVRRLSDNLALIPLVETSETVYI